MAEYSRKLHIRKGNTVTDIDLYTSESDVESTHLVLRDGSTKVYAALVPVTDADATGLRVRKGSTVYAVSKISPYYRDVGLVMASGGNNAATFVMIRTNGDSYYRAAPTEVPDAVGIVMASGGNNAATFVMIDKNGNPYHKAASTEVPDAVGIVMTSGGNCSATFTVIDKNGNAM